MSIFGICFILNLCSVVFLSSNPKTRIHIPKVILKITCAITCWEIRSLDRDEPNKLECTGVKWNIMKQNRNKCSKRKLIWEEVMHQNRTYKKILKHFFLFQIWSVHFVVNVGL